MDGVAAPPYRTNAWLAAAALALPAATLVLAPLLVLPLSPFAAGLLVAAAALATPFATAVLHEAVHSRLAPGAWNDRIARILAVGSGVSFDVLRFGHLTHHRFNRHALDRPDVIEPGQNAWRAAAMYYLHLLGGLFLFEVLATLAMLLPRPAIDRLLGLAMSFDDPAIAAMRRAARRGLDRRLARVRLDALGVIAVYAAAFHLYGAWWPMLLMGILLRGLIVSLQDNLPHYGTPPVIGADAHNSSAPRWAQAFMLNQNLHAVHHDRPDLPWDALPAAFGGNASRYTARYVPLMFRQFLGPRRPKTAA